MLGHHDGDRRQLGDLVAPKPPARDPLVPAELVPATTAPLGVVIDDLVDLVFRQQLASRSPVAGLAARLALAAALGQLLGLRPGLRATLLTRLGRIGRRRRRTVARVRTRPLLKPPQPLLKPLVLRAQLIKTARELQDERHAALPPAVKDRLRLRPLHAPIVRRQPAPALLWSPNTERLRKCRSLRPF